MTEQIRRKIGFCIYVKKLKGIKVDWWGNVWKKTEEKI
jgi:hypothetical protein